MLNKKMLVAVVLNAVFLTSCGENQNTEETPVVTSTTAVQTTQATTETTTVPETTADIEVPENAAYKRTKYCMKDAEKQPVEISFFDEHDNIICEVSYNLSDNTFRTKQYVYKYNDDGTISTKKLITENGISSNDEYEYNDNGKLKSIAYFSEGGDLVKTKCYEYNDDGRIRLESTFKPDDSEPCSTEAYEYEYDENGRISRKIITITDNSLSCYYDGTETIDYTYDENGNILTKHSVRKGTYHTLATDENEDNMTVYTYNSENQLISSEITDEYGYVYVFDYEYYKPENSRYIDGIEIPENAVYKQTEIKNNSHGFFSRTVNIFDESENMLVSVLYSSETSTSPDERTVYTYDNDRLIGEDFYAGNGVLLYRTIYEYDDNGVIISDTSYYGSTTVKTEYAYDGNGRLISKEYPSGSCEYYKYDNNGNIIETTCGDITDEYTYDEENRLIRHRHNVEYDWRASYTYNYKYEYEEL